MAEPPRPAPDDARHGAGRWLAVRVAAWGLRAGLCAEHMMEALVKAYPHQDGAWRLAVIEEAEARNVIKANRKRMRCAR